MLSLLISKVPLAGMILPLFSYRMDIRCFLSGLGRARRCAVLNCYNSGDECVHHHVVAEASAHDKKMEDFMGTKIFVF